MLSPATEPAAKVSTGDPLITYVEALALLGVAAWYAGCCILIGASLY